MSEIYNVTGAGIDPATDRQRRIRTYFISMSIRTICVLLLIVVPGWWALIPALGAIFLPALAVMMANNAAPVIDEQVSAVTPTALPTSASDSKASQQLIVVDAFADRHASGDRIDDDSR